MPIKQVKLSERSKNVEFDVEHWRERFLALKKRLPRNWIKDLVEFNGEFDSYEGTLSILAVKRGRAGLAKTMEVVSNLEAMLHEPQKNTSIYKKWQTKKLKAS